MVHFPHGRVKGFIFFSSHIQQFRAKQKKKRTEAGVSASKIVMHVQKLQLDLLMVGQNNLIWVRKIKNAWTNVGLIKVSTKFEIKTASQGPYFSSDSTVNPLMHNWNFVFLTYCDGTSFSSDNGTQVFFNGSQLHFRGKRVLQAVADDLFKNRGLNQAKNVVISGKHFQMIF